MGKGCLSRLPRALCFLIVAAVAACPVAGRAAETTTAAVTGTVRSGGIPVASATVSLSSPSARYAVATDAQGRFSILGVLPDSYAVSVDAPGFEPQTLHGVRVLAGDELRESFELERAHRTIAAVRASGGAFTAGSTSDTFTVTGAAAQAQSPVTSTAGLSSYSQGTVQGAVATVPGIDLDPFGNAIVRAGRVGDAAFEYDSIAIPQGLIAEPGGNVAGAQLPTTGVASTAVTLAGYTNESDNALGGVIDQIPAVGTSPGSATVDVGLGAGTQFQFLNAQLLTASRDLRWRYALATTLGGEYVPYGDGTSFYPSEAATYGLALQSRSQFSVASNVHFAATPKDDVSVLVLDGQAAYNQYGSPFAGQTVGEFNGAATAYPGSTNPDAPVKYASGLRGSFDVLLAAWQHTGAHVLSRVQLYQSRYGSSAGGPFWDENGFPDGSISLSQVAFARQSGLNFDNEAFYDQHHVRFGAEFKTNTSYLDQVVPTADEFITSNPTLQSYLVYLGDTWSATGRLRLMGTARITHTHVMPSTGFAYDAGAIDPHFGVAYRIGSTYTLRANYDRITVAPAPLEADRTDSTNVDASGNPAPFVPLAPETANDFTYSFEGTGRTRFRLTYYQKFEQNLIDVLPFNYRSAAAAGLSPTGVGVPTNVGELRASGLELYVARDGFALNTAFVRAFSSSASQFAYNDLNVPAIAAGHLFPVSYQPDFTAELSYQFKTARDRVRITPSLSYSTGYPYGNGTMVYTFDASGKPVRVPNDNYVNPGANYYFLKDPSAPFNAATNPYIGNLGTNEGGDPNTLRSTPQIFVNLHAEAQLTPRITAVLDVGNVFGNASPTALQGNPYLIGPPGYKGGNATYDACYGQILAGTVPCAPGLPAGTTPYKLGNGIPTNNGVTQAVPWTYGTAAYIPQSYPNARTLQLRLRYAL
jgi:hypothetical protein